MSLAHFVELDNELRVGDFVFFYTPEGEQFPAIITKIHEYIESPHYPTSQPILSLKVFHDKRATHQVHSKLVQRVYYDGSDWHIANCWSYKDEVPAERYL